MADVTDSAFRHIIAKYAKPEVLFTEFVSADGLCHPLGRKKLIKDLEYTEIERPIVAQLFTSNPAKMFEAAKLVKDLGFDGLDINMGCPDRTIEKQGAGACLIKNPKLARELIISAREGSGLPISVKTRLGYNNINDWKSWLGEILEENPVALTVHLRSRKEMSKVPAHWELSRDVSDFIKKAGVISIGNGDVLNLDDAKEKAKESGFDGVMLGKAVFGNPYLFAGKTRDEIPVGERVKIMIEHTKLFEEKLGNTKSFSVMKKFFKAYITGHDRAREFQEKLMATTNALEVEKVAREFVNFDQN